MSLNKTIQYHQPTHKVTVVPKNNYNSSRNFIRTQEQASLAEQLVQKA